MSDSHGVSAGASDCTNYHILYHFIVTLWTYAQYTRDLAVMFNADDPDRIIPEMQRLHVV